MYILENFIYNTRNILCSFDFKELRFSQHWKRGGKQEEKQFHYMFDILKDEMKILHLFKIKYCVYILLFNFQRT